MKGEIRARFENLRAWLDESSADKGIVLLNIVNSISEWHHSDWLNEAPARPDDLAAWLLDNPNHMHRDRSTRFDIAAVAEVSQFIISVTKPDDWSRLPSYFSDRLEISGNTAHLSELREFFKTELFRELTDKFPSAYFSAKPWARQRALDTMARTWIWPLKIAVYAEYYDVGALTKRFHDNPFFSVVPVSKLSRAPILFVLGDTPLLKEVIKDHHEGAFAYAFATGAAKDAADLARICNLGRCAGAGALDLPNYDSTMLLGEFLGGFVEDLAVHGLTLDAAIRTVPFGSRSTLYAHDDPLRETPFEFTLQRTLSQIKGIRGNAELILNSEFPILNLQARAYSIDEFAVRTSLREVARSRPAATEWMRLLQDVQEQIPEVALQYNTPYFGNVISRKAAAVGVESPQVEHDVETYIERDSAASLKAEILGSESLPPVVIKPVEVSLDVETALPRVQSEIFQNSAPTSVVRSGTPFVVKIWIGQLMSPHGVQADQDFPSHELEDSHEVQILSLIFMPLVGCESKSRGQASRIDVGFSKRRGVSEAALFNGETTNEAYEFGARILVLYRNKVLQSLMLTIPVIGYALHDERRIVFDVENAIRTNFSGMREGRSFDFAFVLNHNESDQQGVTTIGKNYVDFREPAGNFVAVQKQMAKELAVLNDVGVVDPKAVYGQMQKSLFTLARLGNVLRDAICDGQDALETLTSAKNYDPLNPIRIQVVEAKVGAFIPVEFFYDYLAPNDGAKLCAKFQDKGFPITTCTGCKDRGSAAVICPIGFWGVSKVIERRPKSAGAIADWADYRIGETDCVRAMLPPMTSTVFGLSEKISHVDKTAIGTLIQKKFKTKGRLVTDWDEWKKMIPRLSPSLLIVAGHTSVTKALPSLEISGKKLCVSQVEVDFLRAMEMPSPVVVLLGCETHYAPEALLKLSGRFKQKGAAVVIATLATIRGSQTPACLDQLTQAFSLAHKARKEGKKDASTAGFALLSAKQKLLSSGQSIALSLTAIGDAEWEF
ncbi:hypothetical protein [Duganella sp. HH105]|uniref:hypothetical protein n=1 Tax=Duganella sp. HH105 TaxID=1781067 RepID=UPI00089325F5|nr:hypothetical protein [Duganella sp. HH105]OEZ62096.1 hypothetical protein DUGA6_17810 [Duganella sp. HH105]